MAGMDNRIKGAGTDLPVTGLRTLTDWKNSTDRRDLLKKALALGPLAYAAPMILASARPALAQSGSNPLCAGLTCATFTSCFGQSSCVCAATASGGGFCILGSTSCSGTACSATNPCGAGFVCLVNTCCGAAGFCAPTANGCSPTDPPPAGPSGPGPTVGSPTGGGSGS